MEPANRDSVKDKEIKVFISYAREDYEIAKKIYSDLKKNGISPWIDKEDISPGANWELEIEKSIEESDFFLLLISSYSINKKGYIQKEQKAALKEAEKFPEGHIFIIPVIIGDVEPCNKKLKNIQRCDLFSSYEDGLNRILKVVKNKPSDMVSKSHKNKKFYTQAKRLRDLRDTPLIAVIVSVFMIGGFVYLMIQFKTYSLTITPDPSNAKVQIVNPKMDYQPGMLLKPRTYEVFVSLEGFKSVTDFIEIKDRNIINYPVVLKKVYTLTINPKPSDAKVIIEKPPIEYYSGIELETGIYHVAVSKEGFETQFIDIIIKNKNINQAITLIETLKVDDTSVSKPPDGDKKHSIEKVNKEPKKDDELIINIKNKPEGRCKITYKNTDKSGDTQEEFIENPPFGKHLKKGNYKIEVDCEGYYQDGDKYVEIPTNLPLDIALLKSEPQKKAITINIEPNEIWKKVGEPEVKIDGEPQSGKEGKYEVELSGIHDINVFHVCRKDISIRINKDMNDMIVEDINKSAMYEQDVITISLKPKYYNILRHAPRMYSGVKELGLQYDGQPATYISNSMCLIDNNDNTITDYSTGLMWKKDISEPLGAKEGKKSVDSYIRDIRIKDYNDWRVPTVDELASLMTKVKNKEGHYIDQRFIIKNGRSFWTADYYKEASYFIGDFDGDPLPNFHRIEMMETPYVRAVRTNE